MALALHFTTPALRGPLALLQFNDTGCCILGDCKGELCGRKVRRLASRDFSRRTAPPYFGQRDAQTVPKSRVVHCLDVPLRARLYRRLVLVTALLCAGTVMPCL